MTAPAITAAQIAILDPIVESEKDRIAPLTIGYSFEPDRFSEFLLSVTRPAIPESEHPVLRDKFARANFLIHEYQIDDAIERTFRACVDDAVRRIRALDAEHLPKETRA